MLRARGKLWAIAWAAFFFLLINLVILAVFCGEEEQFVRFRYNPSYEEIQKVVDIIRNDKREIIVFLGGSVMWGKGTPDPMQTIPISFESELSNDNIAVYNLGINAARPLDFFVFTYLLKDHVDLFVTELNYQFFSKFSSERVRLDPTTYVRINQLFRTHATQMYDLSPELQSCISDAGIPAGIPTPRIEHGIRDAMQSIVPIFMYKDKVNDIVFRQHPSLLLQRFLIHVSRVLQGTTEFSFAAFLSSPDSVPQWEAGPPKKYDRSDIFGYDPFREDQINVCVLKALSLLTTREDLPFVYYVLPLDHSQLTKLVVHPQYKKNVELIISLVGDNTAYNFDETVFDEKYFIDRSHLTPEGNMEFGRALFNTLKEDNVF